jgi:Flp pilus assembly protein TadD
MLAKVAEAAGDVAAQRQALARAIEEHHTALELARELAGLSGDAGDESFRRLAASRIVEVDPFDAGAYAIVGQLALADGDSPAALTAFRRALAAGPEDPVKAHTDLAEALLAAGARADAKAQAVLALEMAPRYERAQEVLLAVVDGAAGPR